MLIERGEQRALIVGDTLRALRQLPRQRVAVGVGQQRIIAWWCGEDALGEPAHPHALELDTEGKCGRADEDTLAQPADAISGGLELQRERSTEHFERGVFVDLVETTEPINRGFDAPRGLLLERRPFGALRFGTDPAPDEGVHPSGEL